MLENFPIWKKHGFRELHSKCETQPIAEGSSWDPKNFPSMEIFHWKKKLQGTHGYRKWISAWWLTSRESLYWSWRTLGLHKRVSDIVVVVVEVVVVVVVGIFTRVLKGWVVRDRNCILGGRAPQYKGVLTTGCIWEQPTHNKGYTSTLERSPTCKSNDPTTCSKNAIKQQ